MKFKFQLLYWIIILILFTVVTGYWFNDVLSAFYFIAMQFPVIVLTSYLFNFYLVPRLLHEAKYFRFSVRLIYIIVISMYIEMLVITLSFIILANYQYEQLPLLTRDVFILAVFLYFFVFLQAFLIQWRENAIRKAQLVALEKELSLTSDPVLQVRVNRRHKQIPHAQILFLESLADYIQIHVHGDEKPVVTKEKISAVESRLPNHFVRVHRSFIVNKSHIDSFSREEVLVNNYPIKISRTYRKAALESMGEATR